MFETIGFYGSKYSHMCSVFQWIDYVERQGRTFNLKSIFMSLCVPQKSSSSLTLLFNYLGFCWLLVDS